MQTVKLTFVLAALFGLIRYIPVYYCSSEFDEAVKHATARARSETQLKVTLLNEAKEYSLPVKESDISINKKDNVLRVTVDYAVPMNMIIFNHELKFHAMATGMAPEQ
jgi:hypothetical protein